MEICSVQPTLVSCFLCVDPPDCSRHLLDVFCTSSDPHPISRTARFARLNVSQANLPMMTSQKTMDHRLNKEPFSHVAVSKQPDSYRYTKNMQSIFKDVSFLLQCPVLPCDSPGKTFPVGFSSHILSLVFKLPVLDTTPSTSLLGLFYYL